jgi:hypothetical protein
MNTTIVAIAPASAMRQISTISVGEAGNSAKGVWDGSLVSLFASSFSLAALPEAHTTLREFSCSFSDSVLF